MSDVSLEIAMQEIERHARAAAESDVRDGGGPPPRSQVMGTIPPWVRAAAADSMDILLDLWEEVYDATRAELEESMQHVVRWVGVADGDGWTLGYGPQSRDLSVDEAQALYEEGATIVIADCIGAPVETTRSPLEVERDLARRQGLGSRAPSEGSA
jgi:hypothetical protein